MQKNLGKGLYSPVWFKLSVNLSSVLFKFFLNETLTVRLGFWVSDRLQESSSWTEFELFPIARYNSDNVMQGYVIEVDMIMR